jgi:hypothetical protein
MGLQPSIHLRGRNPVAKADGQSKAQQMQFQPLAEQLRYFFVPCVDFL